MANQPVTPQQLINAGTDCGTIEDAVNGAPEVEITSRLGRKFWTLATFDSRSQQLLIDFQAAINTIVLDDGVPAQIVSINGTTLDSFLNTKADKTSLDLKADKTSLELKADKAATYTKTEIDSQLANFAGGSSKFYPTLAEANADIANIQVNTTVTTGDSGVYYKETETSTTLTKSPYDPVQISKDYTISILSVREAPSNVNVRITDVLNRNTVTPTVVGTGQAGQVVTLSIGEISATTIVNSQGTWQWKTPTLQELTYTVTARHTDTSGVTSTDSMTFAINTRQGLFDRSKMVSATWVSVTGVISRTLDPTNQFYNSNIFILPVERGATYFFYYGSQNLNSPNNSSLHIFDKIEDAVFVQNNINPVVTGRIELTAVEGKTGWYQYTVPTTPETIKSIVCTIKLTSMDLTSTLRIYKDSLPQDA